MLNVNHSTPQPKPVRLHVLLISDDATRLQTLHRALSGMGVELTTVGNPDKLLHVWCRGQDLVVIDVSSERLLPVLRTLRSCRECQDVSIFVDISRLGADPPPAGLLPTYRAFPCSFDQIVTLARHRQHLGDHNSDPRRLL
jgi:CheY-like chemotaxis protein